MFLPVYASLPLSPRFARHFQPKAKRLIVFSRRYAPKNTIRLPPHPGTADTKEEKIHSFIILYTLLTISYAGFFAKSHMMFFLLSSFRFYPLLKNDGRGELRFQRIFYCCVKRKEYKSKAVPGHGEGVSGADGRGKLEQTRKNKIITEGRNVRFFLCYNKIYELVKD